MGFEISEPYFMYSKDENGKDPEPIGMQLNAVSSLEDGTIIRAEVFVVGEEYQNYKNDPLMGLNELVEKKIVHGFGFDVAKVDGYRWRKNERDLENTRKALGIMLDAHLQE